MEKINGKDYTEVSFGALQDAISKAKADKDQNDPALDQANITAMTSSTVTSVFSTRPFTAFSRSETALST